MIFSWHTKSPYGSFFYSTIGGSFLLLSVFTGLVQMRLLFKYMLVFFVIALVVLLIIFAVVLVVVLTLTIVLAIILFVRHKLTSFQKYY
jgi:hypothetical protein